MAEKTVSVRLVARVDAYTAAMAKASASTAAFSASSQANLTKVGGSMQTIGKRMTTWVSLPLVGIGAVATKMAMDFETAFAQIQALTNVSASEIDGLKESVLELSGTTAKSPQELAEALYFATSAGLDSAAALDVVTMSAQASAVGMGSTEDVTRVLAAALNVYGESNLSAAQAADILTAAVQEGSAAPEEYAESLGRVIPIAAQMGIGFDEVAGSVAFLTNQGLDADEAVTALRGTLLAIMAPSQQATKTLAEYGLSAGQLQAAIDQDGLLGALELLRDSGLAGNSAAMSKLFEDNRALVGAMNLLNDTSGTLTPILNATENSAGSLGDAFSETADTDAFKMRQALADVQSAMVQLGGVLLPIVADIVKVFAEMVTWFTNLPGPVQAVLGGFAGLAATMGPLIFIGGAVVKNFMLIKTAMMALAGPMSAASIAMLAVGAALAVGFILYDQFTSKSREAEEATRASSAALNTQFPALLSAAVAAKRAGQEVDALAIANDALSLSLAEGEEDVLGIISGFNLGAEDMLDVIVGIKAGGADMHAVWMQMAEAWGLSTDQAGKLVAAVIELQEGGQVSDDTFKAWADDIGITTEELAFLAEGLLDIGGAAESANIENITREFLDGRVAALGFEDSLVKSAEALAGVSRLEDPVAVFRALADVTLDSNDAQLAAAEITPQVQAEMAALGATLPGVADGYEEVGEAAITGAEAMEMLAGAFETSRQKIQKGGRPLVDLAWGEMYAEQFNEYTGAAQNYIETQDAIHTANLEFAESVDEDSKALTGNTAASITNRAAVMDYADAIKAHTQAQLDAGVSVNEVNDTLAENRKGLIAAATAAGLNEQEVSDLLDTIGLMPEDIETVLTLSGDRIFMQKIEAALIAKEDLTAEDVAEIDLIVRTQGAEAGYNALVAKINAATATLDVAVRVQQRVVRITGDSGVYRSGTANLRIMAAGGLVTRPTPALVGEAGPEVVLPLNDPARMAQLLGMPAVAAAMSKLVSSGTASAMGGSSGSYATTQNVTVVMPPGSNGDDVVRALRKWERRRGPVPISVR